ncbi:Serine/threonine-phosphatase BSL2-like protein [Hordeum vulgare]|nr:Serine/threonine-phosphatase BSL2-like protein [Hordeum vulgare]
MHARGLRQGEPISPVLLVLAMDVLTMMVIKAHHTVISVMNGCSSMQRLSHYVDDVVLFIKPTQSDLHLVTEMFHIIGVASGLKVNYNKSSAIMIRSEDSDEELVKNVLPWKIETFPCNHFGLQLSIWQLRRSE